MATLNVNGKNYDVVKDVGRCVVLRRNRQTYVLAQHAGTSEWTIAKDFGEGKAAEVRRSCWLVNAKAPDGTTFSLDVRDAMTESEARKRFERMVKDDVEIIDCQQYGEDEA